LWGKTHGGSSPLLGKHKKTENETRMAILKILQYPNPRLRTVAQKVTQIDDRIQNIIRDMFETHYAAENCAALAATQLDIDNPPAITVIDFSEEKNQPLCLINPEIISSEGQVSEGEGCMSVGLGLNIFDTVARAGKITVRALNQQGETVEFIAEGFLAKCIQHELDHLNGKLYIDHLSHLKRQRIVKKIEKIRKQQRIDDAVTDNNTQ
jgi:peptide deformylase